MGFVGRKPTNAPLTSSDLGTGIVGSANIADGTIANADIANSTINLTTKVTGTLPVANGGTGLAALGTANQVLAVNSGATALEYQAVSSDYVLLATTTASSSASVSFDGYFSSTYSNYQIHFYNLDFSTGTDVFVRFRIANADVTSSDYKYGNVSNPYFDNNGNANGTQTSNAWSSTNIKLNNDSVGTATGDYVTQGVLYLQNPLSSSNYKICMGDFAYMGSGVNIMKRDSFLGMLQSATTALSGITFFPGSGNIVTGIFKLYGIK